jgi:4-oxalocrotonate tautomerase
MFMPIIQVDWVEGRSVEQKRELVQKITQSVVEACKCPPEAVTVIIRDQTKTNIGKDCGLLADK